MATVKGYKIKIVGDKDAAFLTEAQGRVVEAQLETGTRFIKLPGKTIKASSISYLEEVIADESCFPVPSSQPRRSGQAQYMRTRLFVDGEETSTPSRILERLGTPYMIERVEVISSKIVTGEDGRTRTAYEYGAVVDRSEVYYDGIYPVMKKVG